MIQDNLSGTLGVSQDQTLFCSNAWNKDDNQSKRIMREESVSDPICSAEKRWAGIAPQVMQEVIPMQDDGTTSMTKHGPGWHEEDVGYTVNTVDRQSVAYGFEPGISKREGNNSRFTEEKCGSLRSSMGDNQTAVAYGIDQQSVKEEPILLESNQNHATIQTNGISTTLPASMGMGGGYVPMVCDKTVNETTSDIQGFDGYNQQSTGNITMPLRSKNADSDHIPIAYGIGRDAFNMGENAQFGMSIEENTQPPITAKGAGGYAADDR